MDTMFILYFGQGCVMHQDLTKDKKKFQIFMCLSSYTNRSYKDLELFL